MINNLFLHMYSEVNPVRKNHLHEFTENSCRFLTILAREVGLSAFCRGSYGLSFSQLKSTNHYKTEEYALRTFQRLVTETVYKVNAFGCLVVYRQSIQVPI